MALCRSGHQALAAAVAARRLDQGPRLRVHAARGLRIRDVPGMGLLGLDYLAVFKVAEIMGIIVDEDMMAKIQMLEYQVLKEQSDKFDEEQALTKAKSVVKNGT